MITMQYQTASLDNGYHGAEATGSSQVNCLKTRKHLIAFE